MKIQFDPGEKVITTIRRHWLIFLFESLSILVAAVIPFVFLTLLGGEMDQYLGPISGEQLAGIITFIIAAWELALMFVFFVILANYYLDIIIVTDKRVIDIDQLGLFARDIATVPIANVEDIKIEVLGILASLFGFGNLYIQTAGGSKEIQVKGVRHPQHAKDTIMAAHQADKEKHGN